MVASDRECQCCLLGYSEEPLQQIHTRAHIIYTYSCRHMALYTCVCCIYLYTCMQLHLHFFMHHYYYKRNFGVERVMIHAYFGSLLLQTQHLAQIFVLVASIMLTSSNLRVLTFCPLYFFTCFHV